MKLTLIIITFILVSKVSAWGTSMDADTESQTADGSESKEGSHQTGVSKSQTRSETIDDTTAKSSGNKDKTSTKASSTSGGKDDKTPTSSESADDLASKSANNANDSSPKEPGSKESNTHKSSEGKDSSSMKEPGSKESEIQMSSEVKDRSSSKEDESNEGKTHKASGSEGRSSSNATGSKESKTHKSSESKDSASLTEPGSKESITHNASGGKSHSSLKTTGSIESKTHKSSEGNDRTSSKETENKESKTHESSGSKSHATPKTTIRCKKDGNTYQPGTFTDPLDPCSICKCFKDGTFKCEEKTCEIPKCDTSIQKQYDGCCWECPPKCKTEKCEKLTCAVENQFYRDDSCCAECGCTCYGALFQPGTFTNPHDPCSICKCSNDGSYKCAKKQCQTPKCGTGIQKQYDGCCWECPPKCKPEKCEKLTCAVENQFYRDGSCCAECGCTYNGTLVQQGTFTDPYDPCNICTCFNDGNYECAKKQCETPKCGTGIQKQYDGCCWECPPKCKPDNCEKLTCPVENQFYRDDSCCAVCGCECYGTLFQPGTFTDPYDPCTICKCFNDGNYKCAKKQCETPKCGTGIQKQYDGCCWECPPQCKPEECEKLTCPVENQFYRDDSCCAECGCECYGTLFQPGTFTDPYDPCNICTCFNDGNYKCEKKQCEAPKCGTGIQVQYGGCCSECPPKCKLVKCKKLTCPVENLFYRDDSCCAECSCECYGTLFPPGTFTDPYDQCNICTCFNDGNYKCEKKQCEAPKCGTGIQVQYDGCCSECPPKCKLVKCKKLTCPVENQFYRDDSCCAECSCECYGTLFKPGTFTDPYDPCNICTCFNDGNYECAKKQCETPKCGTGIQVQYDGCCWECPPKCKPEKCEKLTCPIEEQFYRDDSCCAECGCTYNGTLFPPGPVGNPCENCMCKNGAVICKGPKCPAQKLTCVDAEYDKNCKLICPRGKTCKKDEVVIKYGEFKTIGDQLCTCVVQWCPYAFCAPIRIPKDIEDLQKTRCVAKKFLK